MKSIKRVVAVVVLLFMFTIMATACGSNAIVGSWEHTDPVFGSFTLVFERGGTGYAAEEGWPNDYFTWETSGDQLTMTYDDDGEEDTVTFSINGDTLTLESDLGPLEFTRQ